MYSHYVKRLISYLLDFFTKAYFAWKIQKLLVPYLISHNHYNPATTFIFIATSVEILWLVLIPLMQSSFLQASFGEIVLNISISDIYGKQISFLRALYRNCILFFCPWGAVTWFFTPQKQCLHDLLSDVIVLNERSYSPNLYKTPLKKIRYSIIFIRFLVVAFYLFVLIWLLFKK